MDNEQRRGSKLVIGIVFGALCSVSYLVVTSVSIGEFQWNKARRDKKQILAALDVLVRESNDPKIRSAPHPLNWTNRNLFAAEPQVYEVKTVDGQRAEVVVLYNSTTLSIPGEESIAFLVVDNRVRDWKSCSLPTRWGSHEPLVEDIDGDHQADLGFHITHQGIFESFDERHHRVAGDERLWLSAYRISSSGFRGFPSIRNRTVRLRTKTKTINEVAVAFHEVPRQVVCFKSFLITLSFTNRSQQHVLLRKQFFDLQCDMTDFDTPFGSSMWFGTSSPPVERLEPGKTAYRKVHIVLHGSGAAEATLTAAVHRYGKEKNNQ